ncbi:MAG: sodium:alanine symporter family protein [Pseudomonadota bacterium]
MEGFSLFIEDLSNFLWGPFMLMPLLLGTGLYLTIGLGFMPMRKLFYGFSMLWKGRQMQGEGDISPFNALMTALSATVGTGNIAGVATAITLGGPGALFWMWCTALVGMATKYAEAVCAIKYREVDENGNYVGGPMYYIKNGLGSRWIWLGVAFSFFGICTGFATGNTVQANSIANVFESNFSVPPIVTGIVVAVLVGIVTIGGIKRIGDVAGKLVPFMAVLYVLVGLLVLILHFDAIPMAVELVVVHAFTPIAATGGFAGAAVWAAIRFGVARGIFSNEAGQGSAPIAHAAAGNKDPVKQGVIAMLGTFIDTLIVCSITGLAIIVSGAWTAVDPATGQGFQGATMTSVAFETTLPGFGAYLVTFSLALFAFTTIIGWNYYTEKCTEYLFGVKAIMPFRILWLCAIPVGAMAHLGLIWLIADALTALMTLPNLIALILLSPVIFKLTNKRRCAQCAHTLFQNKCHEKVT